MDLQSTAVEEDPNQAISNDTLDHGDTGEGTDEPPKKRRRVIKPNSEKKFECKHEGCGKSYSRAEHLYRHQLNHTPKNIYRCDFPDCNRYFVRQDLCIRHKERHTTHGSQLQKRDNFAQSNTNQSSDPVYQPPEPVPAYQVENHPPRLQHSQSYENLNQALPYSQYGSQYTSPVEVSGRYPDIFPTMSSSQHNPNFQQPLVPNLMQRPGHPHHRTNSSNSNSLSPGQRLPPSWTPSRRQSFNANEPKRSVPYYGDDTKYAPQPPNTVPPSPVRTYSASSTSTAHRTTSRPQTAVQRQQSGTSQPDYGLASPTGPHFASGGFVTHDISTNPNHNFAVAVSQGLQNAKSDPFSYSTFNNQPSSLNMSTPFGYPIFGSDEFNPAPFTAADDFTAWLFNENQSTGISPSNFMSAYNDAFMPQMSGPFVTNSPNSNNSFNPAVPMQTTSSVVSMLDMTSNGQYSMSESKRQELLDIMQTQFIERPHDAVRKRKDSVFEGDIDSEGHILSLGMMHHYIESYWYHQHAQLPILHKPTFQADKTPNLLLLAVIAIGAGTMDKAYGSQLLDSTAEFANFIAWHIRWEIVRDADFRPPAKLWVFQALILIEIYEKMYSTRALHERAHIHHDTTLTLMRRGSSLLGRPPSDSPPGLSATDPRKSTGSDFSDVNNKTEDSWGRWITTEATRRAAFGAFVIDSIHATMFGHSAKMNAHELRLPLPCDEGLWSAASPAEATKVQSQLQSNGVKPIMFLDGLKKTLNGQRVKTNTFGRTILMSGLLSVSWHMGQRDLQISSLGQRTANSFGGPDKWKGVLLRAFDNWKRDFDEALAETLPSVTTPVRPTLSPQGQPVTRAFDDENIFESRTVLHHLAHIAAHVDVVDCQVFVGANRLLGRAITAKDYNQIREKVERWATKASARDAAFYALKFLAQVLIPPHDGTNLNPHGHGRASPILPQAFEHDRYVVRDDFLLNRPWVLYISALIVWTYGFALEGPIHPPPQAQDFETYPQREADMRSFLDRVASVRAPDDLEHVTGKNRCLGLLMILKDSFLTSRWELTHEAASLLGHACLKLRGEDDDDGGEEMGMKHTGNKQGGMNGHGIGASRGAGGDSHGNITVANAARV